MITASSLKVRRSLLSSRAAIALALSLFVFLFQLFGNSLAAYGIFRDEFYYLACANRLAWGYVDQPPLSVALLWLQSLLFGESLLALRIMPALAIATTVWLYGRMMARMGGNTLAVFLSCSAIAFTPIMLAMGSYFSMNSVDIFLWSVTVYQLIRLTNSPTKKNWIVLGILLGLGLLNKLSFLWLGAGITAGILLSPLRKNVLTPGPWLAALVAATLFSPYLIWNALNDWPHIEFARNAIAYKYAGISRLDFLSITLLQQNPISLLLWLPGLFFYIMRPKGRHYRILGIVFLTVFCILLINGRSKAEYLAPAFPLLFVGGALFWQEWAAKKAWLPITLTCLILISSLLLSPFARPLLPPEPFVNYAATLGILPENAEGKETGALPQFFADRFGWPQMATSVAAIYASLPDAEKETAYVFCQNYGEAGALEYYSRYGLPIPPVISGHNNYWLWGLELKHLPNILIGLGGQLEDYQQAFREVHQVSIHTNQYAMPYENNLPLYLCKNPYLPFSQVWPEAKHYD